LAEAKLVKLGTGTLAMHTFGKIGHRYTRYTQEVIFHSLLLHL